MILSCDPGISGAFCLNDWATGRFEIVPMPVQKREIRGRAAIRFSNGGTERRSTVSIKTEADCPASAFVCPEQTNKTRCCATCGACWSTTKNVAFLEH